MSAERKLKSVESYLERERRILRNGQITELADLAEDREKALALLGAARGNGPVLQRLRSEVDRNNALMEAAASGLRAAIKRISDLRAASGPIGSYSAKGERLEIGSNSPTVERKA
jgi:hypothetical protein